MKDGDTTIKGKYLKRLLRHLMTQRNRYTFDEHPTVSETQYLDALLTVFGKVDHCLLCERETALSVDGIVKDLDSFFCSYHCPVCAGIDGHKHEPQYETGMKKKGAIQPVAILGPDGRDSGRTKFVELRSDGEWPK